MNDVSSVDDRIDKLRSIRKNRDQSDSDRLKDVQDLDLSDISYQEMRLISDILEAGAEHCTSECLQTLEALIRANGSFLTSDLKAGLNKIGDENIEAVNDWISCTLNKLNIKQKRGMASCAAHLYQNDIEAFTNQFDSWHTDDKIFFEIAVDRMLDLFQKDSTEDAEVGFDDELQVILPGLEHIARKEGLDPSQAKRSQPLRQATILLEDIRYHHLDADAQAINENITDYPYLERFLSTSPNWIDTLTQQNKHDLRYFLNYQIRRDEYRSWMRGFPLPNRSEDEPSPSRSRSKYTELLSYYDHCCEVIEPEDSTGDLRDRFLDRRMFRSAVAELTVINVLRREFGWTATEIEPNESESGKRPDAKIVVEDETVWIEVTQPAREIHLSAQGASTIPGNSDTDSPRAHITKKVQQQLSEVKQATSDITMLVLGDQFSKVEGWNVADYVLGDGINMLVENEDVLETRFMRGESRLGHDDVADLDILVHFRLLGDLSSPPYIDGQVYALNTVDKKILSRVGHAFNAGLEVYTPEEIKQVSNSDLVQRREESN